MQSRRTSRQVSSDTFASLVRLFCSPANPKWVNAPPLGYAQNTKLAWDRELKCMARPNYLGALTLDEIRPKYVQSYFHAIAAFPGKQAVALSALRQLEGWAVVLDLLPRPITTGVKITKSDHHHTPWTDEQVRLGEQYFPPHLSRWVTLGANTGQRSSDLVRMSPTDIEVFDGIEGIKVIQQKTKREVWIPITSELRAAMKTWERRPGPWILNGYGAPWNSNSLWKSFDHFKDKIPELRTGLAGLVPHGLRSHACVRLRRAGVSIMQVADMVGMSPGMVELYCKASSQRENASAAIVYLERTIRERGNQKSQYGGS